MAQNLLTCRSTSRKPQYPDIRPVTVWVGASRQLSAGRGCQGPKIEKQIYLWIVPMIHQRGKQMQFSSQVDSLTICLSSPPVGKHSVSIIIVVFEIFWDN